MSKLPTLPPQSRRVPGALIACLMITACAGNGPERIQGPVELESMLSVTEFREAGLDRLSEGELDTLNAVLTRKLTAGGDVDAAALAAWEDSENSPFATFGFEDEHPNARAYDEMTTRLDGQLEGWDKGQRIHLQNGQVWEVSTQPKRTFGSPLSDVPVTVRRAMLGSFVMEIGDRRPAIRVRRVE